MKDVFINREDELKQIESLLDNKVNNAAVILGEGGIGKTRFLEEISKRVIYRDDCLIFLELDFDEYLPQQTINYLNRKILNAVRSVNRQLLETYELDLFVETSQTFTHLVNRASRLRKVFLFDTVEKLSNPALKSDLFSRLKEIENAVFIFAGRQPTKDDQDEFADFERQVRSIDNTYEKPIILGRFSDENAVKYLKAKQYEIGADIRGNIVDKLIRQTDGIPILIDLAVDYVVRDIDIDELLEMDAQNFRRELVQYIKLLTTPLDILVLTLALISPLSVDSCSEILSISSLETQKLVDDAKQLSFVKVLPDQRIKLHDEMERLVTRFIWQSDQLDIRPSKRFTEETLLKASIFFEQVDQQKNQERKDLKAKLNAGLGTWEDSVELNMIEQERELVTGLWLKYGLAVNREGIWNKWNVLYAKIRRAKKYWFIERMMKLVEEPRLGNNTEPYLDSLTETELIEYKLKYVTTQRDVGNLKAATQQLEDMLKTHGEDKNIRATILNQLGAAYRDLGDYERALEYQDACLRIITAIGKKNWLAIAKVENQLGFLYRLLEDNKIDALNLAEKYYLSAIDSLSKYKSEQRSDAEEMKIEIGMLSATITTNLGYIEGLKKNFAGAYDLLDNGIATWKIEAGREREIARAETAKGILKRDEARLDEALDLMKDAIERLHYPNDIGQMAISYFHYGWTQWFKAEEMGLDTAEGIEALHEAKQKLEDALKLASQAQLDRERPGILHQLATVTWRLGFNTSNKSLMTNARQLNQRAISESIRLNNMHYLVDAFTGEAEFDLDILDATRIDDYYDKVLSFEKEYPQFLLFYGRIRRIRGDFYFLVDKAYSSALEMYAQAVPLINSHRGYGPFQIHRELEGIFEKVASLGRIQAQAFIGELKMKWSLHYENNKPGAMDVISWCDNKTLKLQIIDLSL